MIKDCGSAWASSFNHHFSEVLPLLGDMPQQFPLCRKSTFMSLQLRLCLFGP